MGDDDFRLPQQIVILHAFPLPWFQLIHHRHAAVHNHDPVDVGVKTYPVGVCHQPLKRKFFYDVVVKVKGRLLVVVGGG